MKKSSIDLEQTPENSSMAANLEEMKNLGKQMENRRTNKELEEEYGKKPDPIQHDEADK
jgi:hypothetical protein